MKHDPNLRIRTVIDCRHYKMIGIIICSTQNPTHRIAVPCVRLMHRCRGCKLLRNRIRQADCFCRKRRPDLPLCHECGIVVDLGSKVKRLTVFGIPTGKIVARAHRILFGRVNVPPPYTEYVSSAPARLVNVTVYCRSCTRLKCAYSSRSPSMDSPPKYCLPVRSNQPTNS